MSDRAGGGGGGAGAGHRVALGTRRPAALFIAAALRVYRDGTPNSNSVDPFKATNTLIPERSPAAGEV